MSHQRNETLPPFTRATSNPVVARRLQPTPPMRRSVGVFFLIWHLSMTLHQAIRNAERVLPGKEAPDGERDPRWQAIIAVSEHVKHEPIAIWRFTRRWGAHSNADLRTAVATCLLEHLLEHHFKLIFPLCVSACRRSRRFADTFTMCGEFGQTSTPGNVKRFRALKRHLSNILP